MTRHQRYFTTLKWFGKDIAKSQWKKALCSSISTFLSQFLQTSGLGIALYYGGLIAKHEPFELFGLQYDTQSSKELLLMVSLTVAGVFGIGVLFHYLSRSMGLEVRKSYIKHCICEITNRSQKGDFGTLTRDTAAGLTKVARSTTVYCGRAANLIVLALPELIVTLASFFALLYLEPLLTILLSTVFLMGGALVYRANVRAAKKSVLCDRYSPRVRASIFSTIQDPVDPPSNDIFSEGSDINHWLNNFVGRIRAIEEGVLVTGLMTALLLGLLLGGLVLDIMHHDSDWGRIVVYLVLFKVTATQLKKVIRRTVSINRFYPQIRIYWELVTTNELPEAVQVDDGVEDEDED